MRLFQSTSGLLFTVLLLTVFHKSVHAWNVEAHTIMARIAYGILMKNDPVALFWANDILKMYSDDFTSRNEGSKYTFIDAVTWADDIRRSDGSW